MPTAFDAIVVGLGAMGSATCYHLARRGKRVLGLDRYNPPHTFGSSHGQTRIIREAYFEDPIYVPLVQRAYQLWGELEKAARRNLLIHTGGIMIGSPESTVVRGARASAIEHGLRHEMLPATEIRKRFPGLQPEDGLVGILEQRAGILFPEACIEAHLSLSRVHGAELRTCENVVEWRPDGGGVRVRTEGGEFVAETLILTAGARVQSLLKDVDLKLTVERQILFWFEPMKPELFKPDRFPIYLWESAPGHYFYGFPDLGEGIKIARHHDGASTDPDSVNREVLPHEVADIKELIQQYLPDANGPLKSSTVCLYTNTKDGHFLMDRHPNYPQVLIGSPCSGHGFKFASAIGEVLADLATEGKSRFDLRLFRLR